MKGRKNHKSDALSSVLPNSETLGEDDVDELLTLNAIPVGHEYESTEDFNDAQELYFLDVHYYEVNEYIAKQPTPAKTPPQLIDLEEILVSQLKTFPAPILVAVLIRSRYWHSKFMTEDF